MNGHWFAVWFRSWADWIKPMWFPALILFQELVVHVWAFGFQTDRSFLFIWLFSTSLGLFCSFLCSVWGPKGCRWWTRFLTILLTAWFCVQTVYFTIFRTFVVLYSVGGAGQVLQFWRDILAGIQTAWFPLLLLLLPLVWLLFFGKHYTTKKRWNLRPALLLLLCSAGFFFAGTAAVDASTQGVLSARYLYREDFIPQLAVSRFGVMTTLRLDAKLLLLSQVPEPEITEATHTPELSAPITIEVSTAPIPEPTPTPVVYESNVMDIDFEALAEEEKNKTLKAMHQYFAQVEPTTQNEYTGYFEGKNLIWLTAEGFSRFAVDEELTPTLYKLSHEGFVFENFYNPLWWVSTLDGEYAATTSLIPKPGVWSMAKSANNSMYFTMGNQLRREGYATRAYHNHTYSYYHRDQSHPNLGYDYKGLGNGLKVTKVWPESDLEMMEVTGPEYMGDVPFHTYYMTVSGHLNYTFTGNTMSSRHREEVAHLPYSEGPRAYLACQMELDLALENLLKQLKESGELENTVICLSADHYPYGLDQGQLDELNGEPVDMRFDVYHSTLILWCGSMEEPIVVDKPCSSLDILPTLSNLFGLAYDSRLLMGRDILSDASPLVVFSDRSFITDQGRYDSQNDTFTPNEGVEVSPTYALEIMEEVNNKFQYSKLILEQDYYRKIGLENEKVRRP